MLCSHLACVAAERLAELLQQLGLPLSSLSLEGLEAVQSIAGVASELGLATSSEAAILPAWTCLCMEDGKSALLQVRNRHFPTKHALTAGVLMCSGQLAAKFHSVWEPIAHWHALNRNHHSQTLHQLMCNIASAVAHQHLQFDPSKTATTIECTLFAQAFEDVEVKITFDHTPTITHSASTDEGRPADSATQTSGSFIKVQVGRVQG